jgi:uncharacterized membrane protein
VVQQMANQLRALVLLAKAIVVVHQSFLVVVEAVVEVLPVLMRQALPRAQAAQVLLVQLLGALSFMAAVVVVELIRAVRLPLVVLVGAELVELPARMEAMLQLTVLVAAVLVVHPLQRGLGAQDMQAL